MLSRSQLLGLSLSLLLGSSASACPLCGSAQKTFSEDFAAADVVVLAQWSDGKSPAGMLGRTTFSVVEIARGEPSALKKEAKLSVPDFHAGKRGDLFLLFGRKEDDELSWRPLEITEAGYQYLKQAPAAEVPTAKRLEYFVKFLEFSDERIAMDAYWEFAGAPWEDIVKVKGKLDRAKLQRWIKDDRTLSTRLNLYFLLLGLCGNDEDARTLENLVRVPPPVWSLGRDGLMSSYLLLTGDKGLKVLDETKLTNPQAPFSEVYAAMQAVHFMWSYGNGRIEQDRLRKSMRELLDRPELADLVIADLARWEDWSVMDRLMKLYGKGDYSLLMVKRAIVRYMLRASTANGQPGEQAKIHLEKLRQQDPDLVKAAERYML